MPYDPKLYHAKGICTNIKDLEIRKVFFRFNLSTIFVH
ncbi:MAG: hypothetical protein H6R34_195, partial [Bacteroidetes bacterium]|nr:hypothetical protein [Bacteroidota bacterium]